MQSPLQQEVDSIVRSSIGAILDASLYSSRKVPPPPPPPKKNTRERGPISAHSPPYTFLAQATDWIHAIVDGCLRELVTLNLPYKYVLTCLLQQKTGAGVCSSAATFWDGRVDFSQAVHWGNEHMHCLVTVHALHLHLDAATQVASAPVASPGHAVAPALPAINKEEAEGDATAATTKIEEPPATTETTA